MKRVGLLGARGHVGAELIGLLTAHPGFELDFVSSRGRAGGLVSAHHPDVDPSLRYVEVSPETLSDHPVDAIILALPNGKAAPFVAAIDGAAPQTVLLDLSADYRFDPDWYYGLPELTRGRYRGETRISNPGCYATAMQLAVAPMRDLLVGPAQCFGVSGYSGAGTTPSDKNDPDKLRDNLMPYSLAGHVHEREVSRQLGHAVQFMPHVAPHFRGLSITANMTLSRAVTTDEMQARYRDAYGSEPLVAVQGEAPWVSAIAGKHGAIIGGFTLADDGLCLVLVSVLDNLLKGAATQALQNLNTAFGFDETLGIAL